MLSFHILLAIVGPAPTPFGCITEIRARISGISGFDFEISKTDCDTLAKTITVNVFTCRPGQTRKVLLFKFSSACLDPLPTITSVDQHTVQISISEISGLFVEKDKLKDLSAFYKIDTADNPDNDAETTK